MDLLALACHPALHGHKVRHEAWDVALHQCIIASYDILCVDICLILLLRN